MDSEDKRKAITENFDKLFDELDEAYHAFLDKKYADAKVKLEHIRALIDAIIVDLDKIISQ